MSEHNMEYNSEKEYLIIPEYGRNIQMMIQHAKTIEDDDYRQAFIEKIISLMHQMHPQNRNVEDYRAKLWKHVYQIADYDLDVNPPEGKIPTREEMLKRPDAVPYPSSAAKYRHYGHNIQKLIKRATDMEKGSMRDDFTRVIGNYMKLAYRTWNKEHFISDEVIKNDLVKLSKGELALAEGMMLDSLPQQSNNSSRGDKRGGKKRNSSHSNNKRNNNKHKRGGHKKK